MNHFIFNNYCNFVFCQLEVNGILQFVSPAYIINDQCYAFWNTGNFVVYIIYIYIYLRIEVKACHKVTFFVFIAFSKLKKKCSLHVCIV